MNHDTMSALQAATNQVQKLNPESNIPPLVARYLRICLSSVADLDQYYTLQADLVNHVATELKAAPASVVFCGCCTKTSPLFLNLEAIGEIFLAEYKEVDDITRGDVLTRQNIRGFHDAVLGLRAALGIEEKPLDLGTSLLQPGGPSAYH